ncbi:Sulfatase [Symmachiella macrocystis]|uniref:Sulfatase n=1 Tax=Symmachiella macrocystis TaxID=2527985 RepID=A0A5C6B4I0_9PLAN|nr:sulfatase/phosphatase domain-containing protein [Symmachiella macrocystis]TWU07073.1 Sulfatase [Symmachiella macrocystis]
MNAVIVSFERLPLGLLGCYGSQWVQTPSFDQLATESIVFDQHFGENFDPQAAQQAWWTGQYQFPRTHDQQATSTTIFETFRSRDIEMQLLDFDASESGDDGLRAAQTIFDNWNASKDAQHLLWIQCAGTQLAASTAWDVGVERCAAQVVACDAVLQAILAQVAGLGGEPPLLIVTAAAGEILFTRDSATDADHESPLHEERVHVPLIVHLPGSDQQGSRRQTLTQAVDIAPTLADWFDIEFDESERTGKILLPLIDGRTTALRERVYMGDAATQAVRDVDFCLIRSETAPLQLFLKPEDRYEQADAAREYPDVVDAMESALDEFLTGFGSA